MKWKIIADSGCDLREIEQLAADTQYVNVPLTIQIGDTTYVDDDTLDCDAMMEAMYASSEKTSSACPSSMAYMEAFEGAENVLVVTITGTLSGSYNSAMVAKGIYQEQHPDVNIHVFNSLSTAGVMCLLVEKLNQLIAEGHDFQTVVEKGTEYLQQHTRLLFVLARVDNLVKNGRLNKLVGKVVGLLNIRLVGKASDEGTLELLHKPRGQKKAVEAAVSEMLAAGYQGGKVIFSQRNNESICEQIMSRIREQFPEAQAKILPTSGLCSYYAEEEGILFGYEV